jgi:hypothetical protein
MAATIGFDVTRRNSARISPAALALSVVSTTIAPSSPSMRMELASAQPTAE